MISRCYATAICDGSALLNVTFPLSNANEYKKTRKKLTKSIDLKSKINLTINNALNEISNEKPNFISKNHQIKNENNKRKLPVNFILKLNIKI